jgi:hypothetical protein
VDPAGVLSMAEMQSGYISNVSKTTATKGSWDILFVWRVFELEGSGVHTRRYSPLPQNEALLLYRRESNLAVSSSPVTKTMYIFSKGVLLFVWKRKFLAVRQVGLMTHREYRVDHPFPVTWLGNVWEPFPPPLQYRPEPTI